MKPVLSLLMTATEEATAVADEAFAFLRQLAPEYRECLELVLIANPLNHKFATNLQEILSDCELQLEVVVANTEIVGSQLSEVINRVQGEWTLVLSAEDTFEPYAFTQFIRLLLNPQLVGDAGIIAYNVFDEDNVEDDSYEVTFLRMFPDVCKPYKWGELKGLKRAKLFTFNNSAFRSAELVNVPLRIPDGMDLVEYIYAYLAVPYISMVFYSGLNLRHGMAGLDRVQKPSVLANRTEDLLAVTRVLYSNYRLEEDVRSEAQRDYLYSYLLAIVSTCALALTLKEDDVSLDRLERLSIWMKKTDPKMYKRIRRTLLYHLTKVSDDRWGMLKRQGIKLTRGVRRLKA